MIAPRPPVFIHVDLDGLWTLADCYGYGEGASFADDPVFALALPRLLDIFERLELRATFFIVGRDLELDAKREAIAAIAARGHALANHTRSHPIGLESLGEDAIRDEIESTQSALAELTGAPPLGFRAPGYHAGPKTLAACAAAGIAYDGSRLPTPWAPALRWMAGRLRERVASEAPPQPNRGEAKRAARTQYGRGGLASGLYVPPGRDSPMHLFPLAVSPSFRLPLQASLSIFLGAARVKRALTRLARHGRPLTWLLHGMDALAPGEAAPHLPPALARSRAFSVPLETKLAFVERVLAHLASLGAIETTEAWLERTGDARDG